MVTNWDQVFKGLKLWVGGIVIQVIINLLEKNKEGREMIWFHTPRSTKNTNLAIRFLREGVRKE